MKLKKALAFLVCASTAFSLGGCKTLPPDSTSSAATSATSSASAELVPEKGAKLTFQTTTNGKSFGEAVAEKFKKKYDITVNVQEVGAYDSKKLVNDISAGTGPDVVMVADDKALELYQSGVLLELDSRITTKLNQEINPVAMKTVTFNNKVYGVPVSIETYVMFYNKKLVTGAPATSFEQLSEQAKTFNNAKENKFLVLTDVTTGSTVYPMLSVYGWKLFGESGTDQDHPGFDTPEFLKGLQVLKAYHDLIPVKSGDLANPDTLTGQFVNGKTAYLIGGPWNIANFKTAKVDFGVTSLPTYDGKQEKSFAFIQNAHVSASTKYPIAAQLFAEALASADSAADLYTYSSKITARADISNVPGLKDDKNLQDIVKAFKNADPMPKVKRISYYWTITSSIGPGVFDGTMTPQQAVSKAKESWDSYLKTESKQ